MHMEVIYARRPHLRRTSRHLATTSASGSVDRQNPKSFLSVQGAAEYTEDTDRVDTRKVNLSNCWNTGRRNAQKLLRESGWAEEAFNFAAFAREDGVDMLSPEGVLIGVTEKDDDMERRADEGSQIRDVEVVTGEEVGSGGGGGGVEGRLLHARTELAQVRAELARRRADLAAAGAALASD